MSDEISRPRAASDDPEVPADEVVIPAAVIPADEAVTTPAILVESATGSGLAVPSLGMATAVHAAVSDEPPPRSESGPRSDPVASRIPADSGEESDARDADQPGPADAIDAGIDEPGGDEHGADEPAGEGPEIPHFGEELSPEDLARLCDILLAILFATETPLTAARLGHAAGASAAQVRKGLQQLEQRIGEQHLPLVLHETAGQFRLLTAPAFHDHLLRLRAIRKAERLTSAALETLAVIAYRQPVIRAEIEAIRGVKVGPMLRLLLDKKLIRTGERKDVPGRPIQYETTKEFLDRFGIKSVADLPTVMELKRGMV